MSSSLAISKALLNSRAMVAQWEAFISYRELWSAIADILIRETIVYDMKKIKILKNQIKISNRKKILRNSKREFNK